ncbi:kinesin-related protein 4-like [Panonychus citri]|uniref:kinesin-related protein 4-like n=1 Tax=Panonychus citri TaxID=50023 RepID=UPI00230796EE|nr:kinesin-related protein 4-like [Panonychus citri]
MLNSSLMHNLSVGAEKIKSILLENGDEENDGFDDTDDGHNSQFILNGINNESTDLSGLECSYVDIHLLDEKLKLLNVYTDKLTSFNSRITKEKNDLFNEKLTFQTRMSEILKEKERLEIQLKDSKRTVDLLQEELNDKHLQLSALKTRLDGTSCLDINQLKSSINDLKRSLTIEQEKSEHLISKVDGLQLAVEERNNRISQLINELHQVESDKHSLGMRIQELSKEKQFLIEEKDKLESRIEDMAMDREIESEEARLRLQDSTKANKLIPQLMQLVIRDKNDEITELQSQLEDIKEKLNLVLPYSQDLTDPIAMVDELINHYLILKDRIDLQLPTTNQVQNLYQNSSVPGSPRCLNNEQTITSTINKSFGSSNGSRFNYNDHHLAIKNNDLESQLCELQLKYDKIYFTMNNLREENEILKHELAGFREKRNLPFSRDLTDPISMVDELIDQYLILKDKIDSQLNMKSEIFAPNPSVLNSPRSLNSEQMITSTNNNSFGSNGLRTQEDNQLAIKNNDLENQLCELQLKYDKIYFAMNNLREENEILKQEVEGFREERNLRLGLTLPVDCGNSVNGLDLVDKDSDFIDEKDSVEEALIRVHEQSAELLALSEATKRSQDNVIQAIIKLLPIILLDENKENQNIGVNHYDDDGNINVIGIEFNDLSDNYYGSCNVLTSDKMDSFLDKFTSRNLGIKLLDKMLEIKKFYLEACEKIKFYVNQNDTISGQLSTVEEALIKAQAKLDVYQKKYDKVKRKLKDRSNEIISQPNNNNNNEDNHNSQPKVNTMNKVKVDHCNQSELYHQYRRCLSHRNSLIYQKKYLLNVLGGYKLPERATLALLAHVKFTTEDQPPPTSDRKSFKSVVNAVIAIHRINHIRLKHSSYPKKINPQFASSCQPTTKVIVPSSSLPNDLSPLPSSSSSSSQLSGTKNDIASVKCIQSKATIKEFVTRLQKLHRTLGLQYEARYSTADL